MNPLRTTITTTLEQTKKMCVYSWDELYMCHKVHPFLPFKRQLTVEIKYSSLILQNGQRLFKFKQCFGGFDDAPLIQNFDITVLTRAHI